MLIGKMELWSHLIFGAGRQRGLSCGTVRAHQKQESLSNEQSFQPARISDLLPRPLPAGFLALGSAGSALL